MVSIPLDLGDNSISGFLQDDLGESDGGRNWRLFTHDPELGYRELPAEEEQGLCQGHAYWLITRNPVILDTAPRIFTSTPCDSAFAISLESGWNMIGDPFAFPVAADGMTVDGIAFADQQDVQVPIAHRPPAAPDLAGVAVIEPFTGYWVENLADHEITLRIPPVEATAADKTEPTPAPQPGAWTLTLTATCGDLTTEARLGVHPEATDGRDRQDRGLVPLAPGGGLALSLGEELDLAWDIRPGAVGHAWSVGVQAQEVLVHDEVVLHWEGAKDLPAGQRARLIDTRLGRAVDMQEEGAYRFVLSAEQAPAPRFLLMAGDADYLEEQPEAKPDMPARTRLLGNYPNPFNPVTVIAYELAAPGRVTLRIYDLRGRLVTTLVDENQGAGRYETTWRGCDGHGRTSASGTYFAQMAVDGRLEGTQAITLAQ